MYTAKKDHVQNEGNTIFKATIYLFTFLIYNYIYIFIYLHVYVFLVIYSYDVAYSLVLRLLFQ